MLLNLFLAHRDDRVRIAVSEHMDPKQSHGAAGIRDAQGNVRNIPFRVDHPGRIRFPTKDQVASLFTQFDQLGYQAETVFIGRGRGAKPFRRNARD